ncbi:MAG: YdcH family protein [Alphaproteobacteria bacterium]|nr:YdcH family protein [Alphaproteobacteria bacterium]
MNLESHVESLNAKHAEIDDVIAREELRPCPDTLRIAQLKKQKLRLKEEMTRLVRH